MKLSPPKTRRSLKPTDILLVGKLEVLKGSTYTRPSLGISVWCPFCKRTHDHGWDGPTRSDVVSHRVAHCSHGNPLADHGYYIGLDAGHAASNRRAFSEFAALAAAWDARQARRVNTRPTVQPT